MAGQRRRLRSYALHQTAITANGINVVVEDFEARLVVAAGEPLLERSPCRRWWRRPVRGDRSWSRRPIPSDTRDDRAPCCRVGGTGGCRRVSPKARPVFHSPRSRPRAGKMEHGPQQHRSMTVREHEAVSIGPDRILRIEAHHAIPDRIDQRRECHRRTGMSRFRLLHGVDGERADRVDAQLIKACVGRGCSLGQTLMDFS